MRTKVSLLVVAVMVLCLPLALMLPRPSTPESDAGTQAQEKETAFVPPKGYICYRASGPIKVDGRLDEAAWQQVPWTDAFVDIEGDVKPRPRFRTRVKMLWDDQYFYVGADLEEPHVWGTLTEHDSVIFQDNDFEVFIDPNGDNHEYYEFEINALNTGWDLLLPRPYKDGGKAVNSWEIPGLKTGVYVDGTLNDPRDTDRGWRVEIAFPWKVLGELAYQPAPPKDGDQWRVNFSRVEWRHEVVNGRYRKRTGTREDNWVWSPQGVVDMHRPETWGYVQFSIAKVGEARFKPDPAGPVRHLLHRIYYAERDYRKQHGRWARTLDELGLERLGHESLAAPPKIEVTENGFEVTVPIKRPQGQRWHIRQDSRVWADRN
jgi:Carbohydrate family 9 binding domain-like